MTLANKITIARILMIPVFVFVTLDYIHEVQRGVGNEWQRFLAFAIFLVATVSDAVDGYIARRYKQKTELGTLLDPLADKILLLSALILLSRENGDAFDKLPLWFPVLVISRDVMLLTGTILIYILVGKVTARPRFIGKCATVFQMITMGWIMLKIEKPSYHPWMIAAGLCTLVSGAWYIVDGVRQLNVHEQKKK